MRRERLTILLSGMIAAVPFQGGATWAVLQYLLGFRRLGHEVFFVEPLGEQHLRPAQATLEQSENARYFRQVVKDFGLEDSSALLLESTRETVGLPYSQLRAAASRADLLFNISGLLTDETLLNSIALRVYLDLDPAFTQLWHAAQHIDMRFDAHTRFVTIGRNIGEPTCRVPTCGRAWITTLQPLVFEHWPRAERLAYDALTTVANWRGYGSIEHEGIFYGQKAHAFRQFFALPTLTTERFAPALAIYPGEERDLSAFTHYGWQLLDPSRVAATPAAYAEFVRGSKAELGIAKSGYVASRCGWFSDRSICYLASGRPVLAHDTGFTRFLPVGDGLFAFQSTEDVLDSLDCLNSDYARHSTQARALAQEFFDSDKVLSKLLQNLG
jgi:hypothetical protein